MADETDKPSIPEPQRSAPSDVPDPALNGNGDKTVPDTDTVFMSQDGVIKWMEATDRELKILRIQGLILSGAVILLLITTKAKIKLPTP